MVEYAHVPGGHHLLGVLKRPQKRNKRRAIRVRETETEGMAEHRTGTMHCVSVYLPAAPRPNCNALAVPAVIPPSPPTVTMRKPC